ncbi:M55 family metallopeptidase [Silanimonas sp.]|jgi:D-amino peptidase|uniref:M55 family metallopeptidase n=1 Tax=Silanimonas sp. TaxID=1929290 RepID=UPI0022C28003|nr:M55 family metallopeptidase [Silanimonas sp.]MCZ8167086.1 M55 family metallopeptidase [Silanimonas sp.]
MKKLFISADIEGVACISAPVEVDKAHPAEYAPFQRQMTAEVAAACAGAWAAGVESIVIKDAHWTARNIDPHQLAVPAGKALKLIRGWSGHPFAMVQGLDESFDAVAFIGFHAAGGCGGNPLAHTVSSRAFARVELNGRTASECLIYAYAAASVGVPLVFLSGDQQLCDEASGLIDGLQTVATLQGFGASVQSILPAEAVQRIQAGVQAAVQLSARGPVVAPPALPEAFNFKLCFNKASDAYAKSFYPQVQQVSDTELVLETRRYFDVLTFLWFAAQ